MLIEMSTMTGSQEVSHNILGQRLGRKGQATRERILKAALTLLDTSHDTPITLSGVVREASVGMSTLYLYFPDLGALVLAALLRVMDRTDGAFVDRLRQRWPDEGLEESCLDFLRAHFRFWQEHARLLHMRNSLADAHDLRFIDHRNHVSLPLIGLLARQMDADPADDESLGWHMATVMLTAIERIATVMTRPDPLLAQPPGVSARPKSDDNRLRAQSRLMALGIRDARDHAHLPCVPPPTPTRSSDAGS